MNLPIRADSARSRSRSALSRVLVHLPESPKAESLIRFTTELTRRSAAHVRGLTLLDTSELENLVSTCESAAYAVYELERLQSGAERRNSVRASFSNACLQAGLDFDLHAREGQTVDLLIREALLHDLLVVALASSSGRLPGEWTSSALTNLVLQVAAPVLALRQSEPPPSRILLVQDGTQACGSTIRNFLSQRLFPDAACRLLVVGTAPREARRLLRETADYVCRRVAACETGYVIGHPVKVVPAFVQQWEADLVVLGAQRRPAMLSFLFGEVIERILRKTGASLYSNC